jgi:zinc protease
MAYHVGSRNERAGRTGFAHFFEHMMFRGTRNVPNYDVPLQETGAQSNAFTSEDMTVYYETVASEYLERALYLEAERLAFLPSALDQTKFDTEREVVKNERRQSIDNVPYGLVDETLLARVFPKGHPYSWPVIGSMKDLDSASLDDLKAFFAEFYHPGNATLCLTGDFDPIAAKELVARYFAPLAAGPQPAPATPRPTGARSGSAELADQVKLSRIHWSWPTVADDHPDAPALDLLALVLAGGETSRLYKSLVRDLRLATNVSADSDTKEIAGLFTLLATASEGKSTAEIEKVFQKEIARLRAEPPSASELAGALAWTETGFYNQLTGLIRRAVVISTGFAQKGDPDYYHKDFARKYRVTPEDLQRDAGRYLTDEPFRLLVRPLAPGETRTQPEPVGPDPDAAPATIIHTRLPEHGPDWSKLPGPGKPSSFHPPGFIRRSLSSDIDLWISTWKTLPLVDVLLAVPLGTGDDPPGKSGLAELTATLLDKGTTTKSATELAEAFKQLGTAVSVDAGRDLTSVRLRVLARRLEPTLNLLAEMLDRPRFDPEDFDRERTRQLAALLQGPEDVMWIARRALPLVMFGANHPYGKPAEGYPGTVRTLSLSDVRAMHAGHFGPKGATLIIAGDVDPDEVTRLLEKTLGRWRGQNAGPAPRPDAQVKPEPEVVYLVDKPGAVQSVIAVARHWVDRNDPRYMAALVGNHLVGEDFLSRLNKNLREEHGYTYGAGSHFTYQRSRSTWTVASSVRADATAPALQEIIKELDGLAGPKPITIGEIDKSRSSLARSFPDEFESPSDIAAALAAMAKFHLPADYLETYLSNLQKVSPEDIRKVMTEVVASGERFILVVGDRKSVEPELKKAGFRNIKLITYDGKLVGK